MQEPPRTFAVASDAALVGLIERARKRLVVIAPALTQAVADALAARFADLDALAVTVILDTDPEVYRLGFGDLAALDTIRTASKNSLFDLREQPGVRIGVVISDDTTMVYSPVPKTIEAGSTSAEKPNAIVLSAGDATTAIATAAGAEPGKDLFSTAGVPVHREPGRAEVGREALAPEKVQQMQANLQANPPRPFDIARQLSVFSSKVQYVEFSASNTRFTSRQIALPRLLVDVTDDKLKDQINSRIRAPFDAIGKLKVSVVHGGETETIEVDERWLQTERKRIEDEYTFQINNFGRVILYNDREDFDRWTERFRTIVIEYQKALSAALQQQESEFVARLVAEFAPRWERSPPPQFARYGVTPTKEELAAELEQIARKVFQDAISLDAPVIKLLYKNIAPESLNDPAFLEVLKNHMVKKNVPQKVIRSLFESGSAAPATGSFIDR